MVKLALKLLPSATATPEPAWPGPKIPHLRESLGLKITSSSLKYPIPENEMADFEP